MTKFTYLIYSGKVALNLGENWDLGMLTWTQVENSNFEQKSMLQLDLVTNVHNMKKSKRPLPFLGPLSTLLTSE